MLSDLLTLAVEVMFIHRKIDEIKPRGSWVSRLRQIAVYAVETTASNDFSSSKGSEHSEQMKQRALTDILPSLFEIATSYENHVVEFGLFEGSGKVDPGTGKQHTWQAISRPARKPLARKRARRNTVHERELIDCDRSAEKSSPDDSRSDKPKAASSTTQLETSSPRAPTGASEQVVASNGSHASIERQQGPLSQSSLATTASSLNYSKDPHLLDEAKTSLHGSHSAYYGLKTGVKEAMEGTQAQTQTPYKIFPHSFHPAYDGFGTHFKTPTTQPVEWMGGLPSVWQSPAEHQNMFSTHPQDYNGMGYRSQLEILTMPEPCYSLSEYGMTRPIYDGHAYTSLEPC
jgi:hypothetical protein